MSATREGLLAELVEVMEVYTASGGNTIEDDHVSDATLINDIVTDTIGVEFESGARFFITVEEIK